MSKALSEMKKQRWGLLQGPLPVGDVGADWDLPTEGFLVILVIICGATWCLWADYSMMLVVATALVSQLTVSGALARPPSDVRPRSSGTGVCSSDPGPVTTSGPDLCPTENICVSSGAFPKLIVQGIKHYACKYLRIDCNMLSRLFWRHISSHPSQQTQSPIQPTSECRQQYLNLWSTLPKIPSKILGFQIRNILKNCISWGLENIYLSTELLMARDWISTKLLLLPLYEWITDSCSPSLLACVTIHCLMGNGHEKCSKISIVQFWWPKAKCSFAVCEVIITTDQV